MVRSLEDVKMGGQTGNQGGNQKQPWQGGQAQGGPTNAHAPQKPGGAFSNAQPTAWQSPGHSGGRPANLPQGDTFNYQPPADDCWKQNQGYQDRMQQKLNKPPMPQHMQDWNAANAKPLDMTKVSMSPGQQQPQQPGGAFTMRQQNPGMPPPDRSKAPPPPGGYGGPRGFGAGHGRGDGQPAGQAQPLTPQQQQQQAASQAQFQDAFNNAAPGTGVPQMQRPPQGAFQGNQQAVMPPVAQGIVERGPGMQQMDVRATDPSGQFGGGGKLYDRRELSRSEAKLRRKARKTGNKKKWRQYKKNNWS